MLWKFTSTWSLDEDSGRPQMMVKGSSHGQSDKFAEIVKKKIKVQK